MSRGGINRVRVKIQYCIFTLTLFIQDYILFSLAAAPGSGRVTKKTMQLRSTSPVKAITLVELPLRMITSQLMQMTDTAMRLAGLEIAFSRYQWRSAGPNRLWRSSHHLKLVEAWEPAQTAISRSGVVGRMGKKAPTRPSANVA